MLVFAVTEVLSAGLSPTNEVSCPRGLTYLETRAGMWIFLGSGFIACSRFSKESVTKVGEKLVLQNNTAKTLYFKRYTAEYQ